MTLNLKSKGDWEKYCESGNKPENIPTYADQKYQRSGDWINWSDFIGYSLLIDREFLQFKEARKIVRKQNFKDFLSYKKWWTKNKPLNLPARPEKIYKNEGWVSGSDWVGSKKLFWWV